MNKVKRALISVSEKKGILNFAKGLHALGVEILSTGGTARQLREAGIPVKEVSEYTGFPEILDGRVKTLHPKIHGGLLARREKPEHMEQARKHNIGMIDMVVVNLYPFASVTKKKNVTLEEAIENIDIGGPSMLRSAAKNFRNVAVICNPGRYEEVLNELDTNNGLLSDAVLFKLAVEVFKHTAEYDALISEFLDKRMEGEDLAELDGDLSGGLPKEVDLKFAKVQDLRYGENPHQQAAFYKDGDGGLSGLAKLKQLHGKELSFNNILDLDAAVNIAKDFSGPAAVIIKHNNPTGVAQNEKLSKAFAEALSCDPISAFGGIITLNRKVDEATAKEVLKGGFMECVIAPSFAPSAFKLLSKKKNIRLIEFDFASIQSGAFDFKKVHGGLLLQGRDERELDPGELKVVTKKKPTKLQVDAMLFGWKVIKNVKSNAIILVRGKKTIGIGCGQTSRVASVRIAIKQAGKKAKGAILVSDAFLPKTDNVRLAAQAGVTAIIQTGGSIADEDVIKAADKYKIAMVTTGARHFKH
ncbi:MAG: bifunctional phosphoribosylaminoimidazolecarboxamide formyltransferase/IMP cyclohydrolase [Candidatus Omnitrophica bacterium]|nr:bifunctional phosphoribosylaminoimidazolecarboxamide formyltransferase/IMP cyclohydrolase [Candidatus Omnitrophota bacterium]